MFVKFIILKMIIEIFSFFQSKGHVPQAQIAPSSDEYVLDQLSTCEEKLLKLLEELDGKDLPQVVKEMEEEEVGIAKVVCLSRLLKCLRSLYGKQCGPRSDCFYRSSLFWVNAVCFYT